MPTLRFAIDSREAQSGSSKVVRALIQIEKQAEKTAAAVARANEMATTSAVKAAASQRGLAGSLFGTAAAAAQAASQMKDLRTATGQASRAAQGAARTFTNLDASLRGRGRGSGSSSKAAEDVRDTSQAILLLTGEVQTAVTLINGAIASIAVLGQAYQAMAATILEAAAAQAFFAASAGGASSTALVLSTNTDRARTSFQQFTQAVNAARQETERLRNVAAGRAGIGQGSGIMAPVAVGASRAANSLQRVGNTLPTVVSGFGALSQRSRVVLGDLSRINVEFETAAKKAGFLQTQFGKLFSGFAVLFVARGIATLTDEFTNLQNRIRVVSTSQQDLAARTEDVFEVANRTRQAVRSTTELYSRLILSTRQLGIESGNAARLVESINKAVLISGASARESRAGLIQFAQGIASNRLSGDELRSVLEQLPVVADVIGESIGASRGELRELAREGVLTADVIVRAFQEAEKQLDVRFKDVIPTLGSSFDVLRNGLVQFFGEANTANGSAQALATSMRVLGENFEFVADTLVIVGARFAATFAADKLRSIQLATLQTQALRIETARQAAAELARSSAFVKAAVDYGASQEIVNIALLRQKRALFDVERANKRVNLSRSAKAAESLKAAIGGIPGAIGITVTALVVFSDELKVIEDAINGITKQQRNLIKSSDVLFSEINRAFSAKISADFAKDAETQTALLNRALSIAKSQLEALADVARQASETNGGLIPVDNSFFQLRDIDEGAARSLARRTLEPFIDELQRGASAQQVADAIETAFKPALDLSTSAGGNFAGVIQRFNITDELVAAIRQNSDPEAIVEALLPKLILENASADVIRGLIETLRDQIDTATRSLGGDSRSVKPDTDTEKFLKGLELSAKNATRSQERLALSTAKLRLQELARKEGLDQLNRQTAIARALQAIQTRFNKEATDSLQDSIDKLREENDQYGAKGAALDRILAVQAAVQAIEGAGLEATEKELRKRSELIRALEEEFRVRRKNEEREEERERRQQFIDTINEETMALKNEIAVLKAFGVARQRLIVQQGVDNALRRAGIDNVEEFKKEFAEEIRLIEELTIQRTKLSAADRIPFGNSIVGPLRDALSSGEFDDLGKTIGTRLAESILDGFLLSPLEEGLQAFFKQLISGGGPGGGGIGALVQALFSGFGTGPSPVPTPTPSRRGNVIGSSGVKRFALGGVVGGSAMGLLPMLLQLFGSKGGGNGQAIGMGLAGGLLPGLLSKFFGFRNGGVPGMPELPRLGGEPALFAMPGGGIGSIREGGKEEAILPLEHSGLPKGIRLVGTDITLGLGRDASGKLGAMMPAAPFEKGGTPGRMTLPGGGGGSGTSSVNAGGAADELETLRTTVRSLRRELGRDRKERSAARRRDTFAEQNDGERTTGWDQAPGRI